MKDKKITFNQAMDLMEKGILSNRDFDKMCYNGQIEYEKCEETDFINMTEKERNIELQNRAYNKGITEKKEKK